MRPEHARDVVRILDVTTIGDDSLRPTVLCHDAVQARRIAFGCQFHDSKARRNRSVHFKWPQHPLLPLLPAPGRFVGGGWQHLSFAPSARRENKINLPAIGAVVPSTDADKAAGT